MSEVCHAFESRSHVTYMSHILCVTNCTCVREFEQGGKSESCHVCESQSHVTYLSLKLCATC